jgi:O-antigen/teichoic acid export membrane protein
MGPFRKLYEKLAGKLKGDQRAGLASVGWMGISFGATLVCKLGSNLLLTRLLAPEAFGLIGTAMAFLTLLDWLSDLGIQPALIRHKHGTRSDWLSTGWWISTIRGTIVSVIAAAAAFPLVEFYERPELLGVLLALSSTPFLLSLRSPGMPLLRRNLKYKGVFIDELTQTATGSIGSVSLAFFIPSAWAIVGGTIGGSLAGIIVSYILVPMKPGKWNIEARKELCTFGRAVMINTIVMALWLNIDRLVGLRFISATEMGLYTIAFNLVAVLEALITRTCDVHFSMLSRLQDEQAQNAWQKKVARRVTMWLMPILAGGVLLGQFVIDLLYDDRYAGAGIILSIFMARLMIRGIGQLQFQHLLARGEVRNATFAYAVALAVQFAVFLPLVTNFGAVGLAISGLISTTVLTVSQALFTNREVTKTCPVMRPVIGTAVWMIVPIMAITYWN